MGTPETSTMLVLVSASCLRDWNLETLISDLSRCDVQISKSFNINTLSWLMESVRAWQSRECQQALGALLRIVAQFSRFIDVNLCLMAMFIKEIE